MVHDQHYAVAVEPVAQDGIMALVAQLLGEAADTVGRDQQAALDFVARATELLGAGREAPEKAEARPDVVRGGLASWQIRRVREHVEANLDGAIRVADLAELTRLSVSHFSRAFRASFEEAPHSYVMRRRIERSQELMLTTKLPLSQVALQCGFADQAHLSKSFRNIVGQSPNSWRRARMEVPDAA